MDFFEWRDYGIEKGWIDPPICSTHDWFRLSDEEGAAFEDDGDPCIMASRFNEDKIALGGCDES